MAGSPSPLDFGQSSTLFVDAIRGYDLYGRRGGIDKPFRTIAAALAAAKSGESLYLFPGMYNERVRGKNDVRIVGPQADLVYAGSEGGGIFDDSATNGTGTPLNMEVYLRSIQLNSVLSGSSQGENGAFTLTNASSSVYVECLDISNGIVQSGVSQRSAAYVEAGKLVLNVKRRISCERYDALIQTGGTLSVTCDDIYTPTTTGGDGIEWEAGTLYLRCNKIDTYGSSINSIWSSGDHRAFIEARHIVGNTLAMEGAYPDTNFYVASDLIESATQHAVETEGGYPHIKGAVIRGAGDTEAVFLLLGGVALHDCVLVGHGSADESIAGSGNLKIFGTLSANKDKGANVTVTVGAFPTADAQVA